MSATVKLDTSGAVFTPTSPKHVRGTRWSDLDPFTQGYVEAMFASGRPLIALRGATQNPFRPPAFRDLAPSALARIMKDCAEVIAAVPTSPMPNTAANGQIFWQLRQVGQFNLWPPLTVYLGGDGLIYLRDAVSA
jgi:hypothetical protein